MDLQTVLSRLEPRLPATPRTLYDRGGVQLVAVPRGWCIKAPEWSAHARPASIGVLRHGMIWRTELVLRMHGRECPLLLPPGRPLTLAAPEQLLDRAPVSLLTSHVCLAHEWLLALLVVRQPWLRYTDTFPIPHPDNPDQQGYGVWRVHYTERLAGCPGLVGGVGFDLEIAHWAGGCNDAVLAVAYRVLLDNIGTICESLARQLRFTMHSSNPLQVRRELFEQTLLHLANNLSPETLAAGQLTAAL